MDARKTSVPCLGGGSGLFNFTTEPTNFSPNSPLFHPKSWLWTGPVLTLPQGFCYAHSDIWCGCNQFYTARPSFAWSPGLKFLPAPMLGRLQTGGLNSHCPSGVLLGKSGFFHVTQLLLPESTDEGYSSPQPHERL